MATWPPKSRARSYIPAMNMLPPAVSLPGHLNLPAPGGHANSLI